MDNQANKNSSDIHGKEGIGRFTFFTFSTEAVWNTIYKMDNKNYKYKVQISSKNLDEYETTEQEETTEPIGTSVEFYNFEDEKFDMDEFYEYIILEFSWFLELNKEKNYSLVIEGVPLDYFKILKSCQIINYKHDKTNCEFSIKYCIWNKKLHEEYSKYYYINSKNIEQYKENTTLNNKGDKFFHSVFIKSSLFDNFSFVDKQDQISFIKGKDAEEFIWIIKEINNHLRNMRNPFIKEYTKEYITKLKENGIYPNLNNQNCFDIFREDSLDEMIETIYSVEPKIFSNLNIPQQKTLIRLFDLTLQSGEIGNLYKILEGILDMQASEREELANLLEYTEMSHITRTISLIKDRMQAISDLKELVLNKDLKANERDHVQKLIEKHYWIFGEEYYLVTAEEPDFEEALRRYLYILRGEINQKGSIKIDSDDKQKEMDIFAVQRKLDGTVKKSIVVELKHPNKTITHKELQQVKTYFNVIDEDERFNTSGIEWVFFLIGNKINREIEQEYENAKSHGESCLVYNVKGKKIYVKTWSNIFVDLEINYNFLQKELSLKQNKLIDISRKKSAYQIVNEQKENLAVRPEEVAI